MEFISEEEYKGYLSKIDKYKKHCENLVMPFAVCGEKSITHIWSVVGSFKWFVCEKHRNARGYLGGGYMGIMINGEDVPMKYLDEQRKIHELLRDL